MALGSTAKCKGDRPCRKAGTRQTRRTGRQPKQGTRACDVPALQAPQGSHKGHDVPACRADAVSCPFDWRPSCAVGVCEGLVCRTERGSGPVTSGRTCGPDVWSDRSTRRLARFSGSRSVHHAARPDIGPAVAVSRLGSRPGARRQEGQDGAERTGLGMDLVPEQTQGAGAETGTRSGDGWTRRSEQAIRTDGQDRQSGEAVRGNAPGQMAGNGRSKPMVRGVRQEGPDGLVHVRPTSVFRGACQFPAAGLLVCTRCMLVRGASVPSSSFLALFVSFVSVFSSVFQLSRAMISPPMSRATMARMVRPHTT